MENPDNRSPHHPTHEGAHTNTAWKGAAIMVGVIVAFYVLREHWGHALGFLPYLILLACPLMHIFMHGDHAHQRHGDHKDRG